MLPPGTGGMPISFRQWEQATCYGILIPAGFRCQADARFRQGNESYIAVNAHLVKDGRMPVVIGSQRLLSDY